VIGTYRQSIYATGDLLEARTLLAEAAAGS